MRRKRAMLGRVGRVLHCENERCQGPFVLCESCHRARRYCSGACRLDARRRQQRAAGRRYQASEAGRRHHRARQREYRRRLRVTHHSPGMSASSQASAGRPSRHVPDARLGPSGSSELRRCGVCGLGVTWFDPYWVLGVGLRSSRDSSAPAPSADPKAAASPPAHRPSGPETPRLRQPLRASRASLVPSVRSSPPMP